MLAAENGRLELVHMMACQDDGGEVSLLDQENNVIAFNQLLSLPIILDGIASRRVPRH